MKVKFEICPSSQDLRKCLTEVMGGGANLIEKRMTKRQGVHSLLPIELNYPEEGFQLF